ncbi:MAG: UDP-N-acetylmuramoyl-tripeptide--D-alanyl-D-alanine ligase [Thermoanaerobaculia bacterium]
MVTRRIVEAAEAMEGQVIAGAALADVASRTFTGGAIDSRQVRGGELFFALAGSRADGHRFVPAALAAGAAAAVVSQPELAPGPSEVLIRVADPYQALHALTRAIRRQLPQHLVGLTGSAGKTTTKELLAAMLGRRFRVARSPGNLNNLLGFPLALLSIPEGTEWMVAEMGMSTPGELAGISRLARPDVAMLLNVRPVHLERFGTLAAIAEAKAEILAGLAPDGLLLANADDPEVRRVALRHPGRIVWFGHGEGAEVRAAGVEPLPEGRPGHRFRLLAGGQSQEVELPLLGLHNVDNALAAAACAWALGVPLEQIALAAAEAQPAPGRGEIYHLEGGITLIDDSYNSNPEAVSRALEGAAALPAARRWLVLGEMLELGPEAPGFHRRSGREAAERGFSPVFTVGGLGSEIAAGAVEAGARSQAFADVEAVIPAALAELAPGDLLLVKGSRGVALDRVVDALRAARRGEGG